MRPVAVIPLLVLTIFQSCLLAQARDSPEDIAIARHRHLDKAQERGFHKRAMPFGRAHHPGPVKRAQPALVKQHNTTVASHVTTSSPSSSKHSSSTASIHSNTTKLHSSTSTSSKVHSTTSTSKLSANSTTSASKMTSTSPASKSKSTTSTLSVNSTLPITSQLSTSSAAAVTSNSTTSGATAVLPTGKALAGCACGYQLSNFNNIYLKNSLSIDFTKYSSVSDLSSAGLFVANGYQIGNTAPDGTFVFASSDNIQFGSDGVHLVVPGGQAAGGKVTGAQLIFNANRQGMTSMYAEAMIQVDATPGTCQAFWTYTNNQARSSDEQDMEIIAATLMTSTGRPAGLQLTNHAPDHSGAKDSRTIPFPSDPSVGFHKYSIAWDRNSVSYGFDGQTLAGPTQYVSQNPSNLVFNNWGSGNMGFMGAALPTTDVTMRIKSLQVWYETNDDSSMPAGCAEANVCAV